MSRRSKRDDSRITLEDRLGAEVLKRLETMAGEFVRFERGQFGFFIDPARYAIRQRQVGPLGRGRRRKVVAGVDKDGNVITAWIGVDTKNKGTKTQGGELVSIPDGYGEGGGFGGGKGKGKGKGGGGGGGGGGDGSGDGDGDGDGNGSGGPGQGSAGSAKKGGAQSAADVAKAAAAKRAAAGASGSSTESSKPGAGGFGGPGAIDPSAPPIPKPPEGALAAKDNEARGRKKRPLHWAKVPKNLLNGTVWTTLDDSTIVLNEEEIDELFGVDVAPQFVVEAEEAKPEVLPHKRKHNINILLANLKMSADDIKDVIRVPTYKELDANTLQALQIVCPTSEEEQLLNQNQNLRDQVDRTDAFMMDLAAIPGLRGKLVCASAAKSFNDDAVEVIRNMDTFAMIPVEVQNSAKLNKILEAILALGNFLNSGTGRGGAHGFKLEALAMLSTVKDSRGDVLLDYLVRLLLRDFPGVLPLDDMPTLERSATISLDAIGEEVQNLLDNVSNVSEQIKAIGEDPTLVSFKEDMVAFAEEAVKVREEIISLRALMMDKLQSMMAHFGERNKAARGRQEDILRMLREFSDELRMAVTKADEKAEREAKKAAKAARKGGEGPMVPPGVTIPSSVEAAVQDNVASEQSESAADSPDAIGASADNEE